ncbi:hypothetical protein HU200_046694 [Digitaria exilis]|uniref:DUF1618 domain-containing protein n=1 Tax=Digitaria exilis TaxID=1010633 RepID=A0A835AZ39_9POAL|nr:hypothetical protein HU200_046694 [Digitaria exilis]
MVIDILDRSMPYCSITGIARWAASEFKAQEVQHAGSSHISPPISDPRYPAKASSWYQIPSFLGVDPNPTHHRFTRFQSHHDAMNVDSKLLLEEVAKLGKRFEKVEAKMETLRRPRRPQDDKFERKLTDLCLHAACSALPLAAGMKTDGNGRENPFPISLAGRRRWRAPRPAHGPVLPVLLHIKLLYHPPPHQIVNLDPLGRSRTPLLPYSPGDASVRRPLIRPRFLLTEIPQPSLIFLTCLKVVMSAAAFPNWAILEPFVFRRDDYPSFPDKTKAPIRASATTSLGAPFRIAFSFADPPLVSRLYAQLPGFPDPEKYMPLAILSTHRHLILLRVATQASTGNTVQDFFVYSADDPSELRLLPPCTEPYMEYARRLYHRQPRCLRPHPLSTERRLLEITSMGIISRGEGEQEELAVVELKLYKRRRTEVYADICLFRSSSDSDHSPGGQIVAGGKWDSMRVPINIGSNPDDLRQLCLWETDAVVPVGRWLCWVDYYRGILFCDVFGWGPTPYPLKFVNVDRNDRVGYGPLRSGGAFTVTCHTLQLGSVAVLNKSTLDRLVWRKDTKLTSGDLWSANPPECLPRGIIMAPLVDIDNPHVVHFLFSDYAYSLKKEWLVAIDMNNSKVVSFSKYINGREDVGTVDDDLTRERSICPVPFFSFDFAKYLNLSR